MNRNANESFESADAAIQAAIKAAAKETGAVIADGVAATAAFAEAVLSGTYAFESMPDAPKGARAYQCTGGACSVLICEFNDQGHIFYAGTLTTVRGGHALIVNLVPQFVREVYRVITSRRN